MAKEIYNKTQLTPRTAFERHVYHRDMFCHYLRWSHILKVLTANKQKITLLDFGCGSGELCEVAYRNRIHPKQYLGLDIRKRTIDENNEKFKMCDWASFKAADLCQPELDLGQQFDIITCFEVMEHIGHENADTFLDNIAFHCHKNTRVYLSTPNYDPNVGAANNHLLGPNKEIGEWDHFELQKKLEEFFIVERKFGTFASQKDYKPVFNEWQKEAFNALKEYYDSNLISVIMAPMMPAEYARNCLWVLRVKED